MRLQKDLVRAKVDELFHSDIAYAPPFSTTKDLVHCTGMIFVWSHLTKGEPAYTLVQVEYVGQNY